MRQDNFYDIVYLKRHCPSYGSKVAERDKEKIQALDVICTTIPVLPALGADMLTLALPFGRPLFKLKSEYQQARRTREKQNSLVAQPPL
jgi:hypothetical protein